MKYIEFGKKLCLERDAFRCKQCGSTKDIFVKQVAKIDGRFGWHLSNLVTLCEVCSNKADRVNKNNDANKVGVILAGGSGTRLFPLSAHTNKHCLSLGVVPMIFFPVKTMRKFGVKKVIIISSKSGVGEISSILGSGHEWGMEFLYRVQDGAFGIANALNLAGDFVKPEDEIYCILGDNVFDNDKLDTKVKLGSDDACVYLKDVSNPQDYGVAKIKKGKIVKIVEKPKKFVGSLAVVGLYVYKANVFDVIGKIKPSNRGELEISAVNDFFATNGTLQHKVVGGYWNDAGSSIQKYSECFLYGAKKANVSAEEIDEFKSIVFDEK